jgi:large subunit ribosomal protein L13
VDALSYKTQFINPETAQKEWVVVDASGKTVGRLASDIAKILRGKNKPGYTPHTDCGDNVVVINCEKVLFTGKKWTDKEYVTYTGYPGGQRFITPKALLTKNPRGIIEHAVRGMLPKNRIGRELFRNLHVYAGNTHPHQAQQPKEIKL